MAKDNTATQFAAYIWLLDTIYSLGPISKEEILRRYKRNDYINPDGNALAERTFFRWRDDVERLFDVSIKCHHNRDNCYYLESDEDVRKEGLKKWLLNSFSLKNLLRESGGVVDRVLVEEVPSGQRFLTDIIGAIRDNHAIEITYLGFGKHKEHTFQVNPYCLKLFHQRWYVYGKSVYSDENRIYALDRILGLRITANEFELPADFDGVTLFADRYGVSMNDDPKQTVRIKIDSFQVKFLISLPLHPSQKIVESTDEYSIVEYFLVPTYELKQEFRKYGPSLKVLAPDWLRRDFLNDAKCIVESYKKD